ncbi:MAG: ribosome-associated translation inhibitor RaiA [Oscillospiraceae bacterium]|nr:ribosome-associated translation inhibitor RaiA [Oscillospiraceae bacterium]
MNFTFFERRITLDDEIKDYAIRKIEKLDRFFKADSDAHLTFSEERGRFHVEVTLHNNGMYYRVSEVTSDLFATIDSAVAAIERQIRKNKTRLAKRLRDGAIEREIGALPSYARDEEEEPEFVIKKTKRFSLKPMTPEEAILQMNLLGHEFFAFLNQNAGDAFAVVYRRKQGDYGIIESNDGTC